MDPTGECSGDYWRNPQGVLGNEETRDQAEAGMTRERRGGKW